MATLEQIGTALKAAAAAGDTAAATKLVAAYKAMAASAQGSAGAPAQSPDVLALQQAHATMPARPEGSPAQIATAQRAIDAVPPATDGHDFGSQLLAGVTSGLDAIPVAGPSLMGALRGAKAGIYGTTPEKLAAEESAAQKANPTASTVGAITGTVAPFVLGGEIGGVSKLAGPTR